MTHATERSLWLREQFGSGTEPTAKTKPRSQLSLDIVSYQDALSSQASAQADLSLFEIKAYGSRRLLLGITNQTSVSYSTHAVGGEIGRFFSNEQGRYGRLAVGYLDQLSEGGGFIKLVLDTGILPVPDVLWAMRLHSAILIALPEAQQTYLISLEVAKATALPGKSRFEWGGYIGFDYRPGVSQSPGRYEHVLVTLGPVARYESPWGMLSAKAAWRLWMDRENFQRGTTNIQATGSELSPLPDLNIGWVLSF